MALSAAGLQANILAQLAVAFGRPPDDPALANLVTLALATAIVTHITANAVVLPGSFSNSGGPVTGTGTVT